MAPSLPAALLVGEITHARNEWNSLSSLVQLKEFPSGTRAQFLQHCASGLYNDVLVIYRSNESTKHTGPFDAALLSALPSSVKYIVHNGAGYDNIDISTCTARGIAVSNTPTAVNNATADIAIFLLIGALRRITVPFTAIRRGEWRGSMALGHDPRGKMLGILGMGGIGREVAVRAKAFGMRIQYHNRRPLPEERTKDLDAGYVDFDTLLKTSDVISVNLGLNAETRHIISTKEIASMKDGVVIVNTARGPLVDEEALVEGLKSGKIFSAGLDVYEDEPAAHPWLVESEQVVLLPHIGTATVETQLDMELLVLENLREAVEGRGLVTLVPEQRGLLQQEQQEQKKKPCVNMNGFAATNGTNGNTNTNGA